MLLIEKFLKLISGEMIEPNAYGWYHLLCLAIVIILSTFIIVKCRNLSDKKFRLTMLSVGTLMIILELLKQLNRSYDVVTGVWEYDWFHFPFQFCSVPMYVMILIGCLKECKFRECLTSFLATFGLFAGIIVMILPDDVFTESILLNIHTMLHHGLMVVMGMLSLVSGKIKIEHKTILKALPVFAIVVTIAFVSNIVMYNLGFEEFNLFYIGPYIRCHLILLSNIWDLLGISGTHIEFSNFVFLAIYIFGFALAAYIILFIVISIKKLILNRSK